MATRTVTVRLIEGEDGIKRPDLRDVEGVSGWIEDTQGNTATYHAEASADKLDELEAALKAPRSESTATSEPRIDPKHEGEDPEGPTRVETQRNPAAATGGMTNLNENQNPTEAEREQTAFARGENEGPATTTRRGR